MVELDDVDATLYVAGAADCSELSAVVGEILGGTASADIVRTPQTAVVIDDNDEADPERAGEWPGGFLFFPFILDIYAAPDAAEADRARVVAALLTSLWARGLPAVAACQYEDLLPAGAGTGSRSLPWPS